MAFASSFSAFKKWSGSAIAAFLDQPHRSAPGLASYTKFKLPTKYTYKRPDFLELDMEATMAAADHEIRPVMRPKKCLAMDAGYAETINAGKTHKRNEDQSVVESFFIKVAEEFWDSPKELEKYSIPCVYFGIFDGHAGIGAGLMASALLREHIQEKLNEIAHMLILDKEELAKNYLNHGLIQDVNAEKLVAGALEQAFVEFDERIKSEKLDYYIDGGCTALVALFTLGKLFVANAGDCRAVICRDFQAHQMSFDHTPETERQRIQNLAYMRPALLGDEFTRLQFQHRPRRKHLGTKQLYRDRHMSGWGLKVVDRSDIKPQLVSGEGKRAKLLDTISVTRGFGDHDIEFPYCAGLKIKPFMTANPEVKVYDLKGNNFSGNDVLVMASDGLWERFNSEEVIKILKEKFEQQPLTEPRRYIVAAQALVDEARGTLSERGWRTRNNEAASYDDISVFVVPLGRHEDLASYVNMKKQDPKIYRDGSFAKKYVNRDEVEIQTRNALADKSNANNAEQLTNDKNEDGSEEIKRNEVESKETPSTATEKTPEESNSELNS
ncbi:protein phosphatase 1H-like [Rhopilema esculentum]|uniref:protein phosphatase 1H-like n=2 Tax=Rhopilema esculentum TaxID=499914 RepID=UPI0031DEE344